MGGIARIAVELGHHVTGSDANVYPPMSTQLQTLGIDIFQSDDPQQFAANIDQVIIGNSRSRGHRDVEYVLDNRLSYTSGPQWLSANLLEHRWVIAVSGTHGKTSTASMVTHILEHAGYQPGFLIGGVPESFGVSARLGNSDFFVIEADEYDTAFFDKRSKFLHYHANTLVINNLEFDHADIFEDLAAIQKQFHHLIRTLPARAQVIYPAGNAAIEAVIEQGIWSDLCGVSFPGDDTSYLKEVTAMSHPHHPTASWVGQSNNSSGSSITIERIGNTINQGPSSLVQLNWNLIGQHNVQNATMAIAACHHVGVDPAIAAEALQNFVNAKRRLELKLETDNGIRVFDDFAHHPTAIQHTLSALKASYHQNRLIAVLDFRSNTMKRGVHKTELAKALEFADIAVLYQSDEMLWQCSTLAINQAVTQVKIFQSVTAICEFLVDVSEPNDIIVIMSNGAFDNIHESLINEFNERA